MTGNDVSIYVIIAGVASFLITLLLSIHDFVRDLIHDAEEDIKRSHNKFLLILLILIKSIFSSAFGMFIFSVLVWLKPDIDYVIYYGIAAFVSQNAIRYVSVLNKSGEKKLEEKIDEL
jgi:hypothetical protein